MTAGERSSRGDVNDGRVTGDDNDEQEKIYTKGISTTLYY